MGHPWTPDDMLINEKKNKKSKNIRDLNLETGPQSTSTLGEEKWFKAENSMFYNSINFYRMYMELLLFYFVVYEETFSKYNW